MEKKDLPTIWAFASALWGTFKVPDTKQRFDMAMEIWSEMLGEFELPIIKAAMIELSKESDFCTLGKLAKQCQTITKLAKGEIVDVDEVLQKIISAVQTMDKKKAFDELPEIAKNVVGHSSMLYKWAMMESSAFHSVVVSKLTKSIERAMENNDKEQTMEKLQIPIAKTKTIEKKMDFLELQQSVDEIEI